MSHSKLNYLDNDSAVSEISGVKQSHAEQSTFADLIKRRYETYRRNFTHSLETHRNRRDDDPYLVQRPKSRFYIQESTLQQKFSKPFTDINNEEHIEGQTMENTHRPYIHFQDRDDGAINHVSIDHHNKQWRDTGSTYINSVDKYRVHNNVPSFYIPPRVNRAEMQHRYSFEH